MRSLRPRPFALIAAAGALVLCLVIFIPVLAPPSNCGGNSRALAACKGVSACFQLISAERGSNILSIADLTQHEREYFNQVCDVAGLLQARLLVSRTMTAPNAATGRVVIAVCDKPFDNVPRGLFRKAPLTHAVAYADGSTGLILVEDFQHLDLSRFTDLRAIQATNLSAHVGIGEH
jgi:hypothetical protein